MIYHAVAAFLALISVAMFRSLAPAPFLVALYHGIAGATFAAAALSDKEPRVVPLLVLMTASAIWSIGGAW